jgi:hypothetical protein
MFTVIPKKTTKKHKHTKRPKQTQKTQETEVIKKNIS